VRTQLFGSTDHAAGLAGLRDRAVNFPEEELREPGWHHDSVRHTLEPEAAGPPEPDGSWMTACRLVRDYEFPDPRIIRAVYARDVPLRGRDMLLEGRFAVVRFLFGVRVTHVVDEVRRDGTERAWGWSYDTLEGHLERGRMTYEVVKHLPSGQVYFDLIGQSQRAPRLGPVLRAGWGVFGRQMQRRDGEVLLVPSEVRPHPLELLAPRPVADRDSGSGRQSWPAHGQGSPAAVDRWAPVAAGDVTVWAVDAFGVVTHVAGGVDEDQDRCVTVVGAGVGVGSRGRARRGASRRGAELLAIVLGAHGALTHPPRPGAPAVPCTVTRRSRAPDGCRSGRGC